MYRGARNVLRNSAAVYFLREVKAFVVSWGSLRTCERWGFGKIYMCRSAFFITHRQATLARAIVARRRVGPNQDCTREKHKGDAHRPIVHDHIAGDVVVHAAPGRVFTISASVNVC